MRLEETERKLVELQQEHRDLDVLLNQTETMINVDELQVRRLKKRKLLLKDQIEQLQISLGPDWLA